MSDSRRPLNAGVLSRVLAPICGPILRGVADKGSWSGVKIVSQNAIHPAVTFTRASAAYRQANGSLQSAAVNVPRYEYDASGNYLGLLIEPGRTNLALYSQDFTQSWWVKTTGGTGSAPVITSNYTTAPDGTQTAERAVFNIAAGTTSADISTLGSATLTGLTAGNTYGESLWVKTNDGTTVSMTMVSPDTSLKTVIIGPQWMRLSYGATVAGTSLQGVRLRLRGNESTSKSADISIWQGQFEAGAPSSEIATSSATAARSPDVASALLSALPISTAAGTFLIEHDAPSGAPLLYSGSNKILDSSGGSKVAVGYDASGTSMSVDGASIVTGSALTWDTTLDILKSGSAYASAHVKRIVWYPGKLSDFRIRSLSEPVDNGVFITGDALTKQFKVVLPFGDSMLRVTLKPNGFNSLFNFSAVEKASNGNPANATWSPFGSAFTTDWIPPVFVEASNDGDGTTTGFYTGGNHGTNGDASGNATAVAAAWECEVDGRVLTTGDSVQQYAKKITWRWTNNLYAYNTASLQRSVVSQIVEMNVTQDGFEVYHDLVPSEDVVFSTIYCLATTSPGFADSCHYYDGQARARQVAADVTDSGHKSAAPNAWAVVTGGTDGWHSMWIDRTYGWGDGHALDANSPVLRINASFWKFYAAAVSTPTPVSAGEIISMHGGYSWAPTSFETGMDSAWRFNNGGSALAWAFTEAGAGTIYTPLSWTGEAIGGVVATAGGLSVSASAYETYGYRVAA